MNAWVGVKLVGENKMTKRTVLQCLLTRYLVKKRKTNLTLEQPCGYHVGKWSVLAVSLLQHACQKCIWHGDSSDKLKWKEIPQSHRPGLFKVMKAKGEIGRSQVGELRWQDKQTQQGNGQWSVSKKACIHGCHCHAWLLGWPWKVLRGKEFRSSL